MAEILSPTGVGRRSFLRGLLSVPLALIGAGSGRGVSDRPSGQVPGVRADIIRMARARLAAPSGLEHVCTTPEIMDGMDWMIGDVDMSWSDPRRVFGDPGWDTPRPDSPFGTFSFNTAEV